MSSTVRSPGIDPQVATTQLVCLCTLGFDAVFYAVYISLPSALCWLVLMFVICWWSRRERER